MSLVPLDHPCTITVTLPEGKVHAFIEPEEAPSHWAKLFWPGTDSWQSCPDTWAWIEGERVFIPQDGQSTMNRQTDDTPDLLTPWYDAFTGQPAITGLPGSTFSIFL
jgi:hypothetical protein